MRNRPCTITVTLRHAPALDDLAVGTVNAENKTAGRWHINWENLPRRHTVHEATKEPKSHTHHTKKSPAYKRTDVRERSVART